jgi:cytochrome c-type biogenesis protein CcsB
MKIFIPFILALISINSHGSVCSSLAEDTPTLAGGRVKPVFVLAKESIKFLTGKSTFESEQPLTTFCRIIDAGKIKSELSFPLLVEHVDTKKLLGLKYDDKNLGAFKLIASKDLIRSEVLKQKENNSYKKDLTKLWNRIGTFEQIYNGEALQIYNTHSDGTNKWSPISEILEKENSDLIIKNSKELYINANGDGFLLEMTYVKSHIFSYSLLLCLLVIFITVLSKSMKWPVILTSGILILETVGITLRVLISGRAPITNMYETVMFSGYGATIIALCILYFRRDKIFLLAGLGYNILCLFMMMFANNMLNSSISPLVPVLRDNFWLSTHVTTIILSYAALALSWLVANITLFKMRFKLLTTKDYRYYQDLIYTCIKVGIILLAAGIILGGIWADYSWGRFWGWDPKETWSLIVLLFYMVILHGRTSTWITTHRFIILSAAGFMTVMMAWFGVNYILASGLHSYGFSEGGAIFLGSFFIIQIVILIICGKKSFANTVKDE